MPSIRMRGTRELRVYAMDAFNRTFRITYIMELIAIVIAMLGVANTLLSQIIDRRDEILTLRAVGMSRPRVAKLIILESGLVGLAGVALGMVAGLLLSWILAKVIMLQSFGWTIQYSIPWLTAKTSPPSRASHGGPSVAISSRTTQIRNHRNWRRATTGGSRLRMPGTGTRPCALTAVDCR